MRCTAPGHQTYDGVESQHRPAASWSFHSAWYSPMARGSGPKFSSMSNQCGSLSEGMRIAGWPRSARSSAVVPPFCTPPITRSTRGSSDAALIG